MKKGAMMNLMMMLLITVIIAFFFGVVYAKVGGWGSNILGLSRATSITQSVVGIMNIISSSPQNQTAKIKIGALSCTMTLDSTNKYIKTTTKGLNQMTYGMYFLNDTKIEVPSTIECNHGNTIVHIDKNGDVISIWKE